MTRTTWFGGRRQNSLRLSPVNDASSRTNQYSALMLQHLDVVVEGVEENQCECPFCGGEKSLGFNDVKGLWNCFKCGEGGGAKMLVELLEGNYREPDVDLEQVSAQLRSLKSDPSEPPRVLHDGYLLRYRGHHGAHKLWRARGFDESVCERFELGYDPLAEALTLPYRDPATGQLSGIIFRSTAPVVDGSRYKFPAGFARNRSLYGSWLVDRPSSDKSSALVLAEGPTDAVRTDQAGHPAVAQYGSSIGAGQIRLLHRLEVRNLVLFYDYDRAGLRATEKSLLLAEEFFVEKVRWDRQVYCWHSKVCGCRRASKDTWLEHTASPALCFRMRECRCGRIHEPDPCSLDLKEIDRMLGKTVRV